MTAFLPSILVSLTASSAFSFFTSLTSGMGARFVFSSRFTAWLSFLTRGFSMLFLMPVLTALRPVSSPAMFFLRPVSSPAIIFLRPASSPPLFLAGPIRRPFSPAVRLTAAPRTFFFSTVLRPVPVLTSSFLSFFCLVSRINIALSPYSGRAYPGSLLPLLSSLLYWFSCHPPSL